MYPGQSDWNSGNLGSAWYGHADLGVQKVCSTTGLNFLADLQYQLQTRLTASGTLQSFAGPVSASDVQIVDWNPTTGVVTGPGWNSQLLKALYAVAKRDGAPIAYLSAVQRDATQQNAQISPATLQLALWVTYYNTGNVQGGAQQVYGLGSPDDVRIPVGAYLPIVGTRPLVPTNLVRTSGADCVTGTVPIATAPPIVAPSFVQYAPWLVFAVFVVGALGAAIMTRKTPKMVDIRGRR